MYGSNFGLPLGVLAEFMARTGLSWAQILSAVMHAVMRAHFELIDQVWRLVDYAGRIIA